MLTEMKACKYCGRVEEMAHSCDTCLSCRVRNYKDTNTKAARKYYLKNRDRILNKMRAYRDKQREMAAKPETKKKEDKKETGIKRSKWTVHYIKTEGGYIWTAYFRNPNTGRLVKFESGRSFATMLGAQKDYLAATR